MGDSEINYSLDMEDRRSMNPRLIIFFVSRNAHVIRMCEYNLSGIWDV